VELLDPTMLEPTERVDTRRDGDGQWWSLHLGDEVRPAVVRTWPIAPVDLQALKDYAAVETSAADAWFEEETEIFYRPRDPYRRVDILESGRRVRVEIDSTVVAETRRPRLVLETGLPEQWYIPRPDINWTCLSDSEMQSYCQYKGKARYWDVTIGGQTYEAMAWSYEEAIVAASALAGLVGFPRTHASIKTFVNDELLNRATYSPDWHSPSLAIGKQP